ncbi:MAG: hypothetical protein SGJ15_04715 [Bacteroidota bacterium]|nr:hypothetical protein [Bacteroidota bacterium]
MKIHLVAFLILNCFISLAQTQTAETSTEADNAYSERSFLIIASTKNIKEAFTLANAASKKTGLKFRDNALEKDTIAGATFPIDTCKTFGFEWPCYVARGRYDDGAYVSVEYSNAYTGFKKGYFIVIAANGHKENEEFNRAVKKIKQHYPKSYVKRTLVYFGCMH